MFDLRQHTWTLLEGDVFIKFKNQGLADIWHGCRPRLYYYLFHLTKVSFSHPRKLSGLSTSPFLNENVSSIWTQAQINWACHSTVTHSPCSKLPVSQRQTCGFSLWGSHKQRERTVSVQSWPVSGQGREDGHALPHSLRVGQGPRINVNSTIQDTYPA